MPRLYNECMKLVNVRLNEEDARVVARLRAKGISLSDVVRRALRSEDELTRRKVNPEEAIAEMLTAFPTPSGGSARQVSAVDRRAVQKFVRSRLRLPR
jgi:hypothetical protein